jgi:hypothetical protein
MAKRESDVSFRVGRVKAYQRSKIGCLCYHEDGSTADLRLVAINPQHVGRLLKYSSQNRDWLRASPTNPLQRERQRGACPGFVRSTKSKAKS